MAESPGASLSAAGTEIERMKGPGFLEPVPGRAWSGRGVAAGTLQAYL